MRDWECCVKRVQASERDKRGCGYIECAGGVSVSEATADHIPPSLVFIPRAVKNISERETNCDIVIAGGAKLRTRKKALLDRAFLLSSPCPCCRVRCGAGLEIEPRTKEARNERA